METILDAARTLSNYAVEHPDFVFSIWNKDARADVPKSDDRKNFHEAIAAETFVIMMFLQRFIQSMDHHTFTLFCSGLLTESPPEEETDDERLRREERSGIMSKLGIVSASPEELETTVRIIKDYAKNKQLPGAYRTLSNADASAIEEALREGFGRPPSAETKAYILDAIKLRDEYTAQDAVPDWEQIHKAIFAKHGRPQTKGGLSSQVARYESSQRKAA